MNTQRKRGVAKIVLWPGATPCGRAFCAPKSLRDSGVAPGHRGRLLVSVNDSCHVNGKGSVRENSEPIFSENSKRSFPVRTAC